MRALTVSLTLIVTMLLSLMILTPSSYADSGLLIFRAGTIGDTDGLIHPGGGEATGNEQIRQACSGINFQPSDIMSYDIGAEICSLYDDGQARYQPGLNDLVLSDNGLQSASSVQKVLSNDMLAYFNTDSGLAWCVPPKLGMTCNYILDTSSPVLIIPSSATANTESPSGATVSFSVTATDTIDPNPVVTCTKESGSLFPVGTTFVYCTARDKGGNIATGGFNVTVRLVALTLPVASITAPLVVAVNQSFILDGSLSSNASSGKITRYTWINLTTPGIPGFLVNTPVVTTTPYFTVPVTALNQLPLGSNSYKLVVIDEAGNESLPATVNVRIEKTYDLKLSVMGNGVIHLLPEPDINGGTGNWLLQYINGMEMSLSALPAKNHLFVGWSGDCTGTALCSLNFNRDLSVSALFVPIKPGDCDNSGTVSIAEVQSAINMFLGLKAVEACVDQDNSNSVSIAEVQMVINSFLGISLTATASGAIQLPKTGQTTSYVAGDDGALQKGVAWPAPRFTDNSNGTVTDILTGLIWLKNANCFGQITWADALTSVSALASDKCDLTDSSTAGQWRLPNIIELESLVDLSKYSPALPAAHPFISVQYSLPSQLGEYGYYWSSSTYVTSANAWYVSMLNGYVRSFDKIYINYVWPVRGGQ